MSPDLLFLRVPEGKERTGSTWTFRPSDHESEVQRLLELGAHPVDVGQDPDASWTVLADPEDSGSIDLPRSERIAWDVMQDPWGNEFCVFPPRS